MATVILAETNDDLRDLYSRCLSRHGFQVEAVQEGLECLAKLRDLTPDLLILDLEMLWGGGDGVLAVLREDPHLQQIPVILTSSATSPAALRSLLAPPVVQMLAKPFSLQDLLEAVLLAASALDASAPSEAGRNGILVVDDDPTIRMLLQSALQEHGHPVWTACNGEEALDLCSEHGEDIGVVLLDVQMPRLNGPQTFEGIRAFDPEIRVCFMTGDPDPFDSCELLDLGASHLFFKPFAVHDVLRVVRRLLSEPSDEVPERQAALLAASSLSTNASE